MVTADDFLDSFLSTLGVEAVFEFLKANRNDLYTNLLENCLINIEVDTHAQTTSFHLCALHGRLHILQHLLSEENPFFDLNGTDSKNMTCLDYAIIGKHADIINFLSKCGALKYQSNILHNSTENDENELELVDHAIVEGQQILTQTNQVFRTVVKQSLLLLPTDLCNLIVSYNSNVDMLQAVHRYA